MSIRVVQNNRSANEIFLSFKAGEPDALGYYFAKYYSSLLTHTMQLLANKEDAEDVVSEAFVILYKSRDKINDEGHLLNYLLFANRNNCINHIRKRKTREIAESSFNLSENYAYIDEGEVERALHSQCSELENAIAQLSPLKKAVVKAYFYDRKKTKFIASHMRVAEQTVRNQLTKAKVMVRNILIKRRSILPFL